MFGYAAGLWDLRGPFNVKVHRFGVRSIRQFYRVFKCKVDVLWERVRRRIWRFVVLSSNSLDSELSPKSLTPAVCISR